MANFLGLPAEIRLEIYSHLADDLQKDHEKNVRLRHGLTGRSVDENDRLGFEAPLPRALLQVNRLVCEEASYLGMASSPLRIEVGAYKNAYIGRLFYAGPGSKQILPSELAKYHPFAPPMILPSNSIMSSDWVLLSGKFACPCLSGVQHILQHPMIYALRKIQISHTIYFDPISSFRQPLFHPDAGSKHFNLFLSKLSGLKEITVLLNIGIKPTAPRVFAYSPEDAAKCSLGNDPIVAIASTSATESKRKLKFQLEMPTSRGEDL